MKSGIKNLLEALFEESIASSPTINVIIQSVQIIAVESKKMAENVLAMNERLNQQEKLISDICEILVEQPEKKQNYNFSLIPTPNKDTKPN